MCSFPFRLGATSYIYPEGLTDNVRRMAGRVEDVELVLFETEEVSNLPDDEILHGLEVLGRQAGLTYTVHFPLSVYLGSPDAAKRSRSVETCLRVMDLCRPLDPVAFILHFHGDRRGPVPSDDISRWLGNTEESIKPLLETGIPSRRISVETLDYPFELIEPIVLEYDLSVCLDIGHILMYGHPLDEYLGRYLTRCNVLHLHGLKGGEDHRDISGVDPGILHRLFSHLEDGNARKRVLTLEVFSEEDFLNSLSTLYRIYFRRHFSKGMTHMTEPEEAVPAGSGR